MAKTQKVKKSILLRIAIIVFILYALTTLLNLQRQINQQQAIIDEKKAQVVELKRLNEDLQNKVKNNDLYLDQQAREQGYVNPGADVFKEIP